MGTSLNGLTPAGTYPGLIKTGDNAPIDGTLKTLSDGNGNNLPMQASTLGVNFTGTLTQAGTTLQPTLVSGTNIKTINGASLLGSGNIPVVTSPSGVSGAIQFSNGSAFASDASNLFWDDTNNYLGIGTNTPSVQLEVQNNARIRGGLNLNGSLSNSSTGIVDINALTYVNGVSGFVGVGISTPSARLHIKGSGSTSATTSLLVQNSAGTEMLKVRDDGNIAIFTGRIFDGVNNEKAFYFDGNTNVASNYQSVSLRVYDGTAYASGLEVVGSGSESRVGIGTTSPNASAKLQLDSTTKGFLPPRMTTTQKNAISAIAGLVVYDSTTNKLQCYNGSTWNDLF